MTPWSVSHRRMWGIPCLYLLYLWLMLRICSFYLLQVLLQIGADLRSSKGWWIGELSLLMIKASGKCACLMQADLCFALLDDLSSWCECVLCATQMLGSLSCLGRWTNGNVWPAWCPMCVFVCMCVCIYINKWLKILPVCWRKSYSTKVNASWILTDTYI